jgi:hypothetical protein
MIKIDPFYILLMIEILLLQAGLGVILFLKGRKAFFILEKQPAMQAEPSPDAEIPSPEAAEASDEAPLKEEENFEPAPAGPVNSGDFSLLTEEATEEKITEEEPEKDPTIEVKRLQQTVEEKVEIILSLKNKIEEMEKKFENVENEYQILFDQSQKQEQALKAYEKKKGCTDEAMFS